MCLGIVVSDGDERISFCDYNRNSDQVRHTFGFWVVLGLYLSDSSDMVANA